MIRGVLVQQTADAIKFSPDIATVEPVWLSRGLCGFVVKEGGILPTYARIPLVGWKIRELGWQQYKED